MTTINTNYTGLQINGGAEPTATATHVTGEAVALSNIASNGDDLGRARDGLKPSFKLPAPDGNGSAGDVGATTQRIANLSNSIQADIYTFMNLFFQMSLETRKTASEIRSAEREAKFQELQTAADKIREAGVYQMVAGIVGGVMTMASGAMNFAGGAKSLSALKGGTTPKSDSILATEAQGISSKYGGIATGFQGAGQSASAVVGFGASVAQTEQKEHETQAEKDQAQVDMANELYQNMQQTIQEVLSKLAAIQQSNSDTVKQIVRA